MYRQTDYSCTDRQIQTDYSCTDRQTVTKHSRGNDVDLLVKSDIETTMGEITQVASLCL